jgi:hypothetical protein
VRPQIHWTFISIFLILIPLFSTASIKENLTAFILLSSSSIFFWVLLYFCALEMEAHQAEDLLYRRIDREFQEDADAWAIRELQPKQGGKVAEQVGLRLIEGGAVKPNQKQATFPPHKPNRHAGANLLHQR